MSAQLREDTSVLPDKNPEVNPVFDEILKKFSDPEVAGAVMAGRVAADSLSIADNATALQWCVDAGETPAEADALLADLTALKFVDPQPAFTQVSFSAICEALRHSRERAASKISITDIAEELYAARGNSQCWEQLAHSSAKKLAKAGVPSEHMSGLIGRMLGAAVHFPATQTGPAWWPHVSEAVKAYEPVKLTIGAVVEGVCAPPPLPRRETTPDLIKVEGPFVPYVATETVQLSVVADLLACHVEYFRKRTKDGEIINYAIDGPTGSGKTHHTNASFAKARSDGFSTIQHPNTYRLLHSTRENSEDYGYGGQVIEASIGFKNADGVNVCIHNEKASVIASRGYDAFGALCENCEKRNSCTILELRCTATEVFEEHRENGTPIASIKPSSVTHYPHKRFGDDMPVVRAVDENNEALVKADIVLKEAHVAAILSDDFTFNLEMFENYRPTHRDMLKIKFISDLSKSSKPMLELHIDIQIKKLGLADKDTDPEISPDMTVDEIEAELKNKDKAYAAVLRYSCLKLLMNVQDPDMLDRPLSAIKYSNKRFLGAIRHEMRNFANCDFRGTLYTSAMLPNDLIMKELFKVDLENIVRLPATTNAACVRHTQIVGAPTTKNALNAKGKYTGKSNGFHGKKNQTKLAYTMLALSQPDKRVVLMIHKDIVADIDVLIRIMKKYRPHLELLTFGSLEGLDSYSGRDTYFIVGYRHVPMEAIFAKAEAIYGYGVDRETEKVVWQVGRFYKTVHLPVDPLSRQLYLDMLANDPVQAIGRTRGARATKPCDIYTFNSHPLPVDVDEILHFDQVVWHGEKPDLIDLPYLLKSYEAMKKLHPNIVFTERSLEYTLDYNSHCYEKVPCRGPDGGGQLRNKYVRIVGR